MVRLNYYHKTKIVELKTKGYDYEEIREYFRLKFHVNPSTNTIGLWWRRYKNEQTLDCKKREHFKSKITKEIEDELVDFVRKKENRFMTNKEVLYNFPELNCTPKTIGNHLRKRGLGN